MRDRIMRTIRDVVPDAELRQQAATRPAVAAASSITLAVRPSAAPARMSATHPKNDSLKRCRR